MAELNHTIVWCSDKQRSAEFLTHILGLPPARAFFHFLVVDMANGVSLDFYQKEGAVSPQHYAFLVNDDEFELGFRTNHGQWDQILGRSCTEFSRVRSIRISADAGSISPTPTITFWS